MKKVIMLLCIMGLCGPGLARDNRDRPRFLLDLPDAQVRVHHENNIGFTVSNFGFLGSQDGQYVDPETGQPAPGFEFPAGSGFEYLFQGAIWIGAVVDTVDQSGNPTLDTIVSVGNDGWWGQIFELLPPPAGFNSLWEESSIGDEDIHAIYFDTLTDSRYVDIDPNDGRPHIPIGLKITQTSIAWNTSGYDELFAVRYYLENLRPRAVHDVWLGIYYDGDVMHEMENPYAPEQGAQDDLCGFIERDNHGIAWIADNDGQPYDGVFIHRSPRGVAGAFLLSSSEPALGTSFNWWISDIDSERDWGPQLLSNYRGPFPGGGRGTPGGDKAKYQVMSNLERDYDQAQSALPHPEWIAPPSGVAEIANGFDTRFLISFGPMQLGAGEIETVTVALIGGRYLHVSPSNYPDHLRNHETDSASVALYYQNLDFSDFFAKADTALHFCGGRFPLGPLGPPPGFAFTEWSTHHTRLVWQPRTHPALREYRIYRGLVHGFYDPDPITPPGFLDTTLVDSTLQNDLSYYYVIASVDTAGRQGGYSREVHVNTAFPHTPGALTATPGSSQVQLSWCDTLDDDIIDYVIFRAIDWRGMEFLASCPQSPYLDTGLRNGIRYTYQVAAFDSDGYYSARSDSVSVIPMGLDRGILLVNANRPGQFNPDYDSMAVFYDRFISSYQHTITTERIDSLNDIADYSTVIWCGELPASRTGFESYPCLGVLSDYLQAGGRLVLAGPKMFMPYSAFGQRDFQAGNFPYDFLGLSGVRYSSGYTWDFDGGASTGSTPGFIDFAMDSARVARIVNVPPMENGRLFGVGNLIPRDSAEVIYTYRAILPDTSSLHGYPIGIIFHGPNFKSAVLDFPLYFIQELTSFVLIDILMGDFGEVMSSVETPPAPGEYLLMQNYPNPFNPATTISFALPHEGEARLEIYDLLGRRVAILCDGVRPAGIYNLTWEAASQPSGVYFARLRAGDKIKTAKMVLLK